MHNILNKKNNSYLVCFVLIYVACVQNSVDRTDSIRASGFKQLHRSKGLVVVEFIGHSFVRESTTTIPINQYLYLLPKI